MLFILTVITYFSNEYYYIVLKLILAFLTHTKTIKMLHFSQSFVTIKTDIFNEKSTRSKIVVIDKSIPKATAKRLSLYYRIFKRFHADQVEKASSKQIADAMGIDSATVRRDFSYFGELGRRGFGYDVTKLMNFLLTCLMITLQQTLS